MGELLVCRLGLPTKAEGITPLVAVSLKLVTFAELILTVGHKFDKVPSSPDLATCII